jgi:hypothetical protein
VESPGPIAEERLFSESYQRVAHQIEAIDLDGARRVNVDITSAVTVVLGSLPEIRAMRPQIADELPRFDLEGFDQLEDVASAASYAHTQYLIATNPRDGLRDRYEECIRLRGVLQGDAEQLVRRGLVDPRTLAKVTSDVGYKNVAHDLLLLAEVLRDRWSDVENRCGTDLAELDHAARLAAHVLRLAGLREQQPSVAAAASENRIRAFQLLIDTYEPIRKAIAFLRWRQGDADEIAPSLYSARKPRGKAAERAPQSTDPAGAPAAAPASASEASAKTRSR